VSIEVLPATVERFADVAKVFAPRNQEGACWCLSYRLSSATFNQLKGEARPEALKALCARDVAPGVIAYVDREPAGWCAFGPRSEMERLRRSRTIQYLDDEPVWSIVCFVILAQFRRRGLAHRMLDGAIDYARDHGARVLEGYPIDPDGARVSSAFAYVGTTSLFEAAGFKRIETTKARSASLPRWIVRRDLDAVQ
jgi:GNAT superfamily N-acetyltransferase